MERNREQNKLTLQAHEHVWAKNLKRNSKLPAFKNAKTVKHIREKVGEGKELLLVGAGYSLELRIDEIRERHNNGAIIFATDAATKFLYDAKVYPEFIFVLDSKKIGLRFFEGLENELYRSALVMSSAVDEEFVNFIKCFGEFYSFHMYDPSIPEWGGNTRTPPIVNGVAILDKNQDYAAHFLLPNLEYVVNRGNVFNMLLQVAGDCKAKVNLGYGVEHAYQFIDDNLYTRANIRDDTDRLDYSIGGQRIPFWKVKSVFRQSDNKLFFSELAFLNYAKNANDIIRQKKIPYIDRSDGLVLSTLSPAVLQVGGGNHEKK